MRTACNLKYSLLLWMVLLCLCTCGGSQRAAPRPIDPQPQKPRTAPVVPPAPVQKDPAEELRRVAGMLRKNALLTLGSPDADRHVAVFWDVFSPLCWEVSQRLPAWASDKDTFITVHSVFAEGDGRRILVGAALFAAAHQGKWLEYVHALTGEPWPNRERLIELAEGLDLDTAAFTQQLSDASVHELLESHSAAARRLGINSVPAVLTDESVLMGDEAARFLR